MDEKRRKMILTGFLLLVFFFFFFFYTVSHPILPSDMDDWAYMYPRRLAVPIWKVWNPIRIFAEVAMPAVSVLSSVLFMPLTGNIFYAMMIGYAFCMSAAMTALLYGFCCVLRKKQYSDLQMLFWTCFFLLSHFWIFRTQYQENDYMLRTVDVCTYFFYVIPNLLNATAVLWLEADPDLRSLHPSGSYLKKSLFLLLAYFCIFSNLWAGMILAAYTGSIMIFYTVSAIREKKTFQTWFCENSLYLLLLAVWLVSQVFELNGMRADDILGEQDYAGSIMETISLVPGILKAMNRRYAFTIGVLFVGGVAALLRTKDRTTLRTVCIWALASVFGSLYLLLSCSKAGPDYIRRPDVFYGLFFFCSVIVILAGGAMIQKIPFIKLFLPIVLVIILSDCSSPGRTWKECNYLGMPPRIVNNINNDIVKQLKKAEQNGLDSTEIFVPDFEVDDNGLYHIKATEIVGETMWKLGVLERNIIVDRIVPSKDKNILLHTGPDR